MIPKYLYRGDSDSKDVRKLRATIDFSQLQTNLINSGNGREIIERPLLELVDKHVGLGWAKTHFLSFSEDESVAFRFGLSCELHDVESRLSDYSEYLESDREWDFVILKLDTQLITWRQIGNGIYEGFFKAFKNNQVNRVICLDVFKVLIGQPSYQVSLNLASCDKEWLILPASPVTLNSNITQLSAILSGSCISDIRKYKRDVLCK